MALRSRAQETQKARSEASEELRSETTSDYNDTESQASEPSASTADISDADDHLESERVTQYLQLLRLSVMSARRDDLLLTCIFDSLHASSSLCTTHDVG